MTFKLCNDTVIVRNSIEYKEYILKNINIK